jgi:hypothetical protein
MQAAINAQISVCKSLIAVNIWISFLPSRCKNQITAILRAIFHPLTALNRAHYTGCKTTREAGP